MRRNHAGKRVIGTILLIFSFVMLPAAILAVVFYLFPDISKQINEMVSQTLGACLGHTGQPLLFWALRN